MNLDLNYEGFEEYLIKKIPVPPIVDIFTQRLIDGVHYIFKFENGYGASVIKGPGTFGYREDEWELGVIFFDPEKPDEYSLTYNTWIADDVIGHLTDERVREILVQIKELE